MLSTIANLIFFALMGIFGIVSLLTVYVYVRYGRTPQITIASSAVFIVLFFICLVAAYATLHNLISLYAQ